MMRKTSLVLLGAAAGVAITLVATQPRIALIGAAIGLFISRIAMLATGVWAWRNRGPDGMSKDV